MGEAMIELRSNTVPGEASVSFGGDTLNSAVYMRRVLDARHSVDFITSVGCDRYSEDFLAFLVSHSINTQALRQLSDRHMGLYAINLDKEGERSFTYWRERSAAKAMLDPELGLPDDALHPFNVLYLSGVSVAILPEEHRERLVELIERFKQRGGLLAFDSNYRRALWDSPENARKWCERLWRQTDIGLPSVDDEIALYGESEADVIRRFKQYPKLTGVLKRGSAGPIPLNWTTDWDRTLKPTNHVADTTAAGDSFSGTFLGLYLTTRDLEYSTMAAHEVACQVVSQQGAIVPTSLTHHQEAL